MAQKKVMDIRDSGTHLIAVKIDSDKFSPYRVYVMRDPYHRKQIAKCSDMASCISVAYSHILNGG